MTVVTDGFVFNQEAVIPNSPNSVSDHLPNSIPAHDKPRPLMDHGSSTTDGSQHAQIQPWVQAARPLAHPMIFLPLLVGQTLAFDVNQQFSLMLFLYTLLFGVLYQVLLLYVNDYADETVDRANDRYFLSGGSRVIPEGKLRGKDLLAGATVAFLALMGLTAWLVIIIDRPWLWVGTVLAVALGWAYNMKPLQLSHRGHGEILQGLGCGVLLPLIGFYLQQGSMQEFPWFTVLPLFLIFYVGNIVTALPDYPSDKAGGKRTYPVRHGELGARQAALGLLATAYVGVMVANRQLSWMGLAFIAAPAALALGGTIQSGTFYAANTSNFAICKRFVIWVSASQAWVLCAWVGILLFGGLH